MINPRLQIEGRLLLLGPNNARVELTADDHRIEVRSDRLRSLPALLRLAAASRAAASPIIHAATSDAPARALPSLAVFARGHRIAEFDGPTLARLLRTGKLAGTIAAALPAIRFRGALMAAIRRRDPAAQRSDPPRGQQSNP